MAGPVLTMTDRGLYCAAGDFFIDPWRPVDRALITHAHADHARPGHRRYLCTDTCMPVMRHRLGDIAGDTLRYGEVRRVGDAAVSFHPAGHVPGSAQIRVEVAGQVWVVSGDYKVEDDGLSEAFQPLRCHVFISECTFGLPVFHWQSQAAVADQINRWWAANRAEGRVSLLAAYSLGKAQRLLHLLDPGIGPILTHAAVENTNAVLRAQGVPLPDTIRITPELDRKAHPDALIVAPPAVLGSPWARRFGALSTGYASGWMQMRGVRRRRAADRGFVISDHADWEGLLSAITATGAEKLFLTHGYTDIFTRFLRDRGHDAHILATEYGGEDGAEAEDAGDAA